MLRSYSAGAPLSPKSDVVVLDVDLAQPGIKIAVAADAPVLDGGRVHGNSYRVSDWCRKTGAAAGINGGFFGKTVGVRKEFIGLLAVDGSIASTGRLVRPSGKRAVRIARSVLGFDKRGTPHIGWAVGERGRAGLLTEYLSPVDPTEQRYWNVDSAVACGPRLIAAGKVHITDRDERLASPPPLRRTFVGYDQENGKPRHLLLAAGMNMTFQDAADFLQAEFKAIHNSECREAMALDGGASTQLAYRSGDSYIDTVVTRVTVPSAVLVFSKDRR